MNLSELQRSLPFKRSKDKLDIIPLLKRMKSLGIITEDEPEESQVEKILRYYILNYEGALSE
jgi:hypothetical protein